VISEDLEDERSRDRPTVAVGAIVIEGDDLLLVRRARPPAVGTWSIPGGRVERGETLAEAIVRELHEETGVEGACGEMVGWSEVIDRGHHAVILDFRVHLFERVEPIAGDDASAARWVPLGDVTELHLAPGLAEFLHDHGIIPTIT
jgi:mutator protein MutT